MPRHRTPQQQLRLRRAGRARELPARLGAWWRSPVRAVVYGVPGGPMTPEELRALLGPEPPTAGTAAHDPTDAASGLLRAGARGRP